MILNTHTHTHTHTHKETSIIFFPDFSTFGKAIYIETYKALSQSNDQDFLWLIWKIQNALWHVWKEQNPLHLEFDNPVLHIYHIYFVS